MKSLPSWTEKGLVSRNAFEENLSTFKELMSSIEDPSHVNLYFEMFCLLVNSIPSMY